MSRLSGCSFGEFFITAPIPRWGRRCVTPIVVRIVGRTLEYVAELISVASIGNRAAENRISGLSDVVVIAHQNRLPRADVEPVSEGLRRGGGAHHDRYLANGPG